MQSASTRKEIVIAQAALEHGVYFMEVGATDRAAAYFQLSSQKLQVLAKLLTLS
ncbi:MAG TPA: hypothetical protein V6C78_00025 [Crinalium sp.]|jgi:hypothetical protein